MVAAVTERLTAKQTTHNFSGEKFSLKKLNETEGKEQYHIEI
jgi:hypothetical protein